MEMETKEICSTCCEKIAVWLYMPGYSNGESPYSCEDCVNRGCTCNWYYTKSNDGYDEQPVGVEGKDWRWVEHEANEYMGKISKEDGIWESLDSNGKPWPCAEYTYDEEGFEIDEDEPKYNEDEFDR